jgi:hypothetical protein
MTGHAPEAARGRASLRDDAMSAPPHAAPDRAARQVLPQSLKHGTTSMVACTRSSGCACEDCAKFVGVQLPGAHRRSRSGPGAQSLPPNTGKLQPWVPTTALTAMLRVWAVTEQAIDYDAPASAGAERQQDDGSRLSASSADLQQDGHDGSARSSESSSPSPAFVFSPDPIPLDSEGYAPSFTASQSVELREFFERYSVVVVRDVLSADQVAAAAAEVFESAGLGSSPPQTLQELERINWEDVYGSRYNRSKGFIGYDPPDTECAWHSRLAPALRTAYGTLFGAKKTPSLRHCMLELIVVTRQARDKHRETQNKSHFSQDARISSSSWIDSE